MAGNVLLPYKITLLSNLESNMNNVRVVLLPYKITLLSNNSISCTAFHAVLLPYKITLLSNTGGVQKLHGRFYYPIKLHYSQTC